MIERLSKIVLVAGMALFFSVVALGNVIDYDTNWSFMQHVLAMDTTFNRPALMWRAITSPELQKLAYLAIIAWEIVTALVLWIGIARLWSARRAEAGVFRRAKAAAILGLTFGYLLYGIGFLVVASEWFAMWQSKTWNAQANAGMFTLVILAVLIHLSQREDEPENE